jgi:hypothetical protein
MKKNESGDKARVKFRYIEFDVEGGSPAIQDGLRHIAAALTRAAPQTRALPRPTEQPGRVGADAPVNGELPFPPPPDGEEGEAEIDVTPEPMPADAKPRPPRKTPTFSVINGLDLDAGDGYPSLQEFADKKKPEGHRARYLVAAVWLKRYKGVKDFTANHVFTIYKVRGWGSTPTDAGQPLRELKRERLIDAAEKAGSYTVNDAGEARVDRMPEA